MESMLRIIVFQIGTMLFGVEISRVKGIMNIQEIEKISNAPFPNIAGVMKLYGEIVPVLNLHKKLQIQSDSLHREKYVVILISGNQSMAFAVDEIEGYLDVPIENLHSVPAILQGVEMEYIWKIANSEDSMILVLDPDRLFLGAGEY